MAVDFDGYAIGGVSVGEPEKREGPAEYIAYENRMPLTAEMEYFVKHLDGNRPQIANGKNAVEVMEILEKATESLNNGIIYEN